MNLPTNITQRQERAALKLLFFLLIFAFLVGGAFGTLLGLLVGS